MNASLFNLFDQADATIARNRVIIESIRAMQPYMRAMGDAIKRHDDPALSLEQCLDLAKALNSSLSAHKRQNPDSANIDESAGFAKDIALNLAAEILNRNSYEAHPAKCPCDECAAARSCEHYDRKRDGMAA